MLGNFGGIGGLCEAKNAFQNRVAMVCGVAGLSDAAIVRFRARLGPVWERFSAALGRRRAVLGCAGHVAYKNQGHDKNSDKRREIHSFALGKKLSAAAG